MNKLQIEIPEQWTNHGDVNWLEHGGMFVMQDEIESDCFFLISWTNLSEHAEGEYIIIDTGYVDLSDEWIDFEKVYDYHGVKFDEIHTCDDDMKAVLAFEYYGVSEFGERETFTDIRQALGFLQSELRTEVGK